MAKRGDVFRVGEEDQLYLVETVAQNGSVYARKFDPCDGGYGESLLFEKALELNVLFNTARPEQEAGWEYCKIKHCTDWKDDWTGDEYFVAEMVIPNSQAPVGKSNNHAFIRAEPTLGFKSDQSSRVHQSLVDELLKQGWQVVLERRNPWFQLRLKRKVTFF